MSRIKIFSLLSLLLYLLISACKHTDKEVKIYNLDDGVSVKIEQAAGEYANQDSINFLPPPFNIGYLKHNSTKFIVLSNRIDQGKTIEVMPIACVELIDSVKYSYVVSVPTDPDKRQINIKNYGSLATEYPRVKNMIEYWLKGAHMDQNGRINWTSEQIALELMDKE